MGLMRPETPPSVADVRLPPMGHYARATLTVAVVVVVLAAAWRVRNILLLVIIAAVLAIGLDPAVRRLERLKIPRGWSVLIIFLATIGFFVFTCSAPNSFMISVPLAGMFPRIPATPVFAMNSSITDCGKPFG